MCKMFVTLLNLRLYKIQPPYITDTTNIRLYKMDGLIPTLILIALMMGVI